MPQVRGDIVRERAARLRSKGERALAARQAALIGTQQTLLMEKSDLGRTPCFMPVRLGARVRGQASDVRPGALVEVRISHIEDKHPIAA
jgi:threonylcarbamoyladenosine tRNA methylthiotransferase MtaB